MPTALPQLEEPAPSQPEDLSWPPTDAIRHRDGFSPARPIRVPLRIAWREFRIRLLPPILFAIILGAVIWLWRSQTGDVAPQALPGEPSGEPGIQPMQNGGSLTNPPISKS